MRKKLTFILLSLFIAGSVFSQIKQLPETKNYKEVDHQDQVKHQIPQKQDLQNRAGELEVEGFEDVTDSWPAGWMTASSSDLSGSNWQTTDFTQGDNTWFVNTPESFDGDGSEYIYNGDRSAAIGYTAGQSGNPMHWLVSKEMDLPSDTAFLSFMTWFSSSAADGWYTYFYVQIHVDGAWETLLSWNDDTEDHNNAWTSPVNIDLDAYTGKTVKFAFIYEYNDGFQMALDSIAYMYAPPADDAGVSKIIEPASGVHPDGTKDITVVVKNYGADSLFSADVEWSIEKGGEIEPQSTNSWTGALATNETDTVTLGSYNFNQSGDYTIHANTASPNGTEDVNGQNDAREKDITIYLTGQLIEDFEEGSFVNGWESSNWGVLDYNPYAGTYHAVVGQTSSSPAYYLITPKVVIDERVEKISFYAGGMNNTVGNGSTKLELMYSTDKMNWEPFSSVIDFADEGDTYKHYNIELEIPNGEYYLAFKTTSDYYDWYGYSSYCFVDNVIGPFLAAPEAQTYTPSDGATGVSLDAAVSVEFNQKLDSIDFSGIKIMGETEGEVSNVSASLSGDSTALVIDHDPFMNNHEKYTVSIPANTVANSAAGNDSISWSFTTVMTAPEPVAFSPVDSAQGVALDAPVSVVMNQMISGSSLGSISMNGTTEGGPVTGVSASIGEDHKTILIDHDDFAGNEDTITVTIPAGALENEDGVGNADTTWAFITLKAGQPVADSIAPAENEVGVALDAEVLIRFDVDVSENDLTGITIEGMQEGEVSNVNATLTDSTITIAHDAFANNNELYTVTIPAGAVQSVSSSEPNAEINWNFTTIMTQPMATSMMPEDGADNVAADAQVMVEFDQMISGNASVDLDTMIHIISAADDTVKGINAYVGMDGKTLHVGHDPMMNDAQYTATLAANAVENRDGVMNNEMSWQFNTIMAAPGIQDATPDSNAVDVPLDAAVSMVFDKKVIVNDIGAVKISSAANGFVDNVNATLGSDSLVLTIEHDRFFDTNDDVYTVTIPKRSVMNKDMVYNEKIEWSFETVETHDVTFQVIDGMGEAIEDVHIEFGGMNVMTDTVGEALFDGVAVGEDIPFTATKTDYSSVTGYVDVSEPSTVLLTMNASYTVTFNITDGSTPVSGAEVTFNSSTKTTGSQGMAVFEDVLAGEKAYLVKKDEYEAFGSLNVTSDLTENIDLGISGINELVKHDINLYPNPSEGTFHLDNIKGYENAELEVVDMTGKVIHKEQLSNVNNTIHLDNKAEGIYILKIKLDDEVVNGKLMVK